ncbi:MAG: hypothetical protein ACAH12_03530 [Methylophilaceae bacterium]
MTTISIKHNIKDMMSGLDAYGKQVPFAAARALTRTVKVAQSVIVKEFDVKLDRPTPFTKRSLYTKPATKKNLEAMVYLKDDSAGGTKPMSEQIAQQFSGGERARKRIEFWLSASGYIGSSEYVAPGSAAKLDKYGNMSRGQIQQMLSQLRAGADRYAYSSKSARSMQNQAKAGMMFWSRGGRLARGVWMRKGRTVKPILLVIKKPIYKKRIDMMKLVQTVINARFDMEFAYSMSEAIANAR